MTNITSTKHLSTERATTTEILAAMSRVMPRGTRVLVFGGYGCRNLGDEAILSVLLADLRSIGAVPTVVTADRNETNRLHAAETVAAAPAPILRAMLSADAVLIGGGGIFSSYMGARSKFLPIVAMAAKLARKTVMFRALGAYETTPRAVAEALRLAMDRADFVSVRDEATVADLRKFGLRRTPLLEDDPALRLEIVPYAGERAPRQVGLAVRRLRTPQLQARLRTQIIELTNRLIASGRTPLFLPFSAHPSEACEQDDRYSHEIIAACARPAACRVADPNISPGEMLGLVSTLDALVAMRFHAMVFGAISAVPMAALAYDAKCSSFLAQRGLPALELAHVTADEIIEALDATRAADVAA